MPIDDMFKEVKDFIEDVGRYEIDISYPGMEFGKSRRNYEHIVKKLKTITLPNPNTFKYTQISFSELKRLLSTVLNKIFDSAYTEEVENYNSILVLAPIQNPFASTLEQETINDITTPKKIYVSNKTVSIQVASTAHEYMHALLTKHITTSYNRVLSNYHYRELLSILLEYIVIYEISEYFKQDDLKTKHSIIRLQNDVDQINADEKNRALIPALEMMNFAPEYIDKLKKCVNYGEHNAFGYIISDIYSTRLFEIYQQDPSSLITRWKSIIAGETSIQELLKYYGISLRNTETTIAFGKRLEKIPKI